MPVIKHNKKIIILPKIKRSDLKNVEFDGTFKAPRKISEANIQAECYRLLTNKGIKCYLEYSIHGRRALGTRGVRFDMVILKDNKIIAIVEFKSKHIENIDVKRSTKQLTRYESYRIPLIVCNHMTQIPDTIEKIESIWETQGRDL